MTHVTDNRNAFHHIYYTLQHSAVVVHFLLQHPSSGTLSLDVQSSHSLPVFR